MNIILKLLTISLTFYSLIDYVFTCKIPNSKITLIILSIFLLTLFIYIYLN